VNYCVDSKRGTLLARVIEQFAMADRGRFRGTLIGALKGASGPREGQKSTFSDNLIFRTDFQPSTCGPGHMRGSSSCRQNNSLPSPTSTISSIKPKICSKAMPPTIVGLRNACANSIRAAAERGAIHHRARVRIQKLGATEGACGFAGAREQAASATP